MTLSWPLLNFSLFCGFLSQKEDPLQGKQIRSTKGHVLAVLTSIWLITFVLPHMLSLPYFSTVWSKKTKALSMTCTISCYAEETLKPSLFTHLKVHRMRSSAKSMSGKCLRYVIKQCVKWLHRHAFTIRTLWVWETPWSETINHHYEQCPHDRWYRLTSGCVFMC